MLITIELVVEVVYIVDVASSNCTMEIFISNKILKIIEANLSMVIYTVKQTLITVVVIEKDQLQSSILTKDCENNFYKYHFFVALSNI